MSNTAGVDGGSFADMVATSRPPRPELGRVNRDRALGNKCGSPCGDLISILGDEDLR